MRVEAPPDPRVGLCSVCVHARTVVSGKGSTFWLCSLSRHDARYRKYPALPVLRCDGFAREHRPTSGLTGC